MKLFSTKKVLGFVIAAVVTIAGSAPTLATVQAAPVELPVEEQSQKLDIQMIVPEFDAEIGVAGVINSDIVANCDKETMDIQTGVYQQELEAQAEAEAAAAKENYHLVMANVSNSVNVRAEGDEDSEKVGKLYKNCGGELIEKGNYWSHIVSGELDGWVKNEYLYFDDEAKAYAEKVGENVVTIETDCLRARMEPSEEAGCLGLLAVNSEFTLVEELDGWVSIKYDKNEIAYVSSEYVSVNLVVPEGETMEEIKEREALAKASKAKLTKNRGAVSASVDDVTLLGALIYCEAGNQSYEGKVAVGAVVCNRVRSGSFPNTVYDVIYAKGQFGPAGTGKVASTISKGVNSECLKAAQAALNGETTVGDAHYFKRAGTHEGITIGGHVFY